MKKYFYLSLFVLIFTSCVKRPATVENVWPSQIERYWVGPQFLSVPVLDWKIDSGRLVCVKPGGSKGVVLLTKKIDSPLEGFEISFEGGLLGAGGDSTERIGIMLGLDKPKDDKADFSKGVFAGVSTDGLLSLAGKTSRMKKPLVVNEKLIFDIEGVPGENGKLQLILRVRNEEGNNQLGELIAEVISEKVKGLVAFYYQVKDKVSLRETAWFESLEITGEGVNTYPENARGPILTVENSIQNDTLNMVIVLAPLIQDSSNRVVLQTRDDGEWTTIAKSSIPDNNVVTFTLNKRNRLFQSYRVYTHYIDRYGSIKYSYVTGEIEKEN